MTPDPDIVEPEELELTDPDYTYEQSGRRTWPSSLDDVQGEPDVEVEDG